ncbi:MAG TPA: hypothetical protein VIH57_18395 [Bacteroidales bacterium]
MNYIELINRFWRCTMEHRFTASDTLLYFYLLHTCNQLGWKMPFGHSDRHLAALTGLSVSTVRGSKTRLQQRGLITFSVPKIKSKAYEGQSQYSFPTVLKINTVPGTVLSTDVSTVSGTVPSTNTKLNKTKLEDNINPYNPLSENSQKAGFSKNGFKSEYDDEKSQKGKKKREVAQKEETALEFVLPFSSQRFSDAWEMLLQMPKWKGKQQQSLELALQKLSAYEEDFATYLVELAITNNWQGVVFPDTGAKYQQWKQNRIQHGNETINGRTTAIKVTAVETVGPERNYKERF